MRIWVVMPAFVLQISCHMIGLEGDLCRCCYRLEGERSIVRVLQISRLDPKLKLDMFEEASYISPQMASLPMHPTLNKPEFMCNKQHMLQATGSRSRS